MTLGGNAISALWPELRRIVRTVSELWDFKHGQEHLVGCPLHGRDTRRGRTKE